MQLIPPDCEPKVWTEQAANSELNSIVSRRMQLAGDAGHDRGVNGPYTKSLRKRGLAAVFC